MATSGGLVTLRAREFLLYGEFWHEAIHITLGVNAFVANFGFFTIWPEGYLYGDTAYLVNNVIEVFMNLHSMHESSMYVKHNRGKLDADQIRQTQHEFRLNLAYLVGALFFATGALLFETFVYEVCEEPDICLFAGGMCFTLGSFFFVVAAYINSLTVSIHGTIECQDMNTILAVLALGFNTVGSAMYLAGSPFYLPTVEAGDSIQSCTNSSTASTCSVTCKGTEWPAENTGTTFYVIGGTFFMLGKIFRMWLTIRKHAEELHHIDERNRLGPKPDATVRTHAEPRPNRRKLVRQETVTLKLPATESSSLLQR